MNINEATKQMVVDFEKRVYQFINENIEAQKVIGVDENEIDYSKMFVFTTDINADWLPQIAPVSYGIIGEQVYSFVDDGMGEIVCEPIPMWD